MKKKKTVMKKNSSTVIRKQEKTTNRTKIASKTQIGEKKSKKISKFTQICIGCVRKEMKKMRNKVTRKFSRKMECTLKFLVLIAQQFQGT